MTTSSSFSWNRILAWAGGITVLITLFFSLRDFTGFFSSHTANRQEVASLLATAALQSGHGDYRSAWDVLAQADTMGQLEDRVTAAREALAMDWLRSGHGTGPDHSLGALATLVSPVLSKGAAGASDAHKADLLAHLGWAEFYQWRGGDRQVHPDEYYHQALQLSPTNPYAHAMLAHWLLWNHQVPDSATQHFSAALATDSARPFIRTLQIAAYGNLRSPVGDAATLNVLADMHSRGEPVPIDAREPVWGMHWSCFITTLADCDAERLRGPVSPEDHLATWDWVMAGGGYPEAKGIQYEYVEARLREAAGQTAVAAATYKAINAKAAEYESRFRARIAEGLRRTTKPR
ncbi:MAG: hypothetical protein ABJC74_17745 [Gemmatimonadota bacterium]